MLIHQFYDKGLAHASYAIISEGEMMVIDPARNPEPYFTFANANHAAITGIIETHPHADFVSSHLEINRRTGAPIYTSKLVDADYPHLGFDEGDVITLGAITLKALNTPGHSPDSICILAVDEHGREHAIFTGDTLFAGDVGRPDLREDVGNLTAPKEELARAMYHSTREKLMKLPAEVLVYPAHGPGSLCGKHMSPNLFSTIGAEIAGNYALQPMPEDKFVQLLTEESSFTPQYFAFDVLLNKQGAADFEESVGSIKLVPAETVGKDSLLVDIRQQNNFKSRHISGSLNFPLAQAFESWLGAVIAPNEEFYLIGDVAEDLDAAIHKAAKIGYERQIKGKMLLPASALSASRVFDSSFFKSHQDEYTIVDIRNENEVKTGKTFATAIAIPLADLRERANELPLNKPIVVHCAGGYRSAIGSSILEREIKAVPVFDMSEDIATFRKGDS